MGGQFEFGGFLTAAAGPRPQRRTGYRRRTGYQDAPLVPVIISIFNNIIAKWAVNLSLVDFYPPRLFLILRTGYRRRTGYPEASSASSKYRENFNP